MLYGQKELEDISTDDEEGADEAIEQTKRAPSPFLRPFLPLGRTLRDWWRDLLVLGLASLAWGLLSLTIVGGPPAAAALYVMSRSTALHEQSDIPLFLNGIRAYFVRSWLLGAVGLVGVVIWVLDLIFYAGLLSNGGPAGWVGAVFLFYIGVVWLLTLFYAWPMMVCRDDLKLGQLLRNSFLAVLRYPIHSLLAAFVLTLLLVACFVVPPLVVLAAPTLVALLGLHTLIVVAPELVPDESDALNIVG